MNKSTKYKLDIQYFADENNPENTGAGGGEANRSPAIDYGKLAEVIEKRANASADSALKGYLKEQGLTGSELEQAIQSFKSKKAEESKKASEEKDNLIKENEKLKDQIFAAQLESKIQTFATEKKVKLDRMNYVLRLIDRSDLTTNENEIDDEKVKAAIDTVIKDFPELVREDEGKGFTKVGGSGSSSTPEEEQDRLLRKAFGLK